jgi:hypothetical protein
MAEHPSDHDLLIELRTEMRGVRDDIKGLKEGTSLQLSDHEMRIRLVEKRVWTASGIASVLGMIGGYLIQYLIK